MAWLPFREGSENICSAKENPNLSDPTRERPHKHTYGGVTNVRTQAKQENHGEEKTTRNIRRSEIADALKAQIGPRNSSPATHSICRLNTNSKTADRPLSTKAWLASCQLASVHCPVWGISLSRTNPRILESIPIVSNIIPPQLGMLLESVEVTLYRAQSTQIHRKSLRCKM